MKHILLLFCLLFIFNCKGTSLNPEISNHDIKNKPDILNQIESRSLLIQNSDGLENVYYLAVEDSINNLLGVAYFLDWSNEFPDFGKNYKTSFLDIASQIFMPIVYTNWFYIPNSGGFQRILYGKHDIEGIWAVYSLKNGKISSLKSLDFETRGHKEMHYSDSSLTNNISSVSNKNHPFIRIVTWNHMMDRPDSSKYIEFYPIYFPNSKWKEYNMGNKRAEMTKKLFNNFNKALIKSY